MARKAVESGRVELNGKRIKPAHAMAVEDQLLIKRAEDVRTVAVLELNARRGPSIRARRMYRETDESIQLREVAAEKRKLERSGREYAPRPDRRMQRLVRRFKRK